ncbi:MAG: LptF/LptG family permease [Saprospiraceae bacterium]
MLLKKSDSLILKGFVGPYIVSFFIVEFVLIMQFMWKWIDDLLGRGFAMTDYLELIALFGVTIIPMSLPLTVLLSSVMVYGDMAEHFELSSLKSAGQSLVRIFRPALVVAFATAGLSISSSNYFKPLASKAFLKKFNNMRLSKITFSLEEKVFNLDFSNHAIYVDKKEKDGINLQKVLIYYTNQRDKSLMDVMSAKRASMRISEDGKYMIMDLYQGQQYQESPLHNSEANYITKPDRVLPLNRATFSKYRKVFELKDIFKDMSNINLERKKFDMLNSWEIIDQVDTLEAQLEKRVSDNLYDFSDLIILPKVSIPKKKEFKNILGKDFVKYNPTNRPAMPKISAHAKRDTAKENVMSAVMSFLRIGNYSTTILEIVPQKAKELIINGAKTKNSSLKTRSWNNYIQSVSLNKTKQKYLMRLHQQYCWAFVCILLLFIGGPMGAIVRKGGFGYPMLVAIGFYMSFVILIILGERLVYSSTLSGTLGAWLPFLVLLPFATIVTYLALKDIRLNFSFLKKWVPQRLKPLPG